MSKDFYASRQHRELHARLMGARTRRAKSDHYRTFLRDPGTDDPKVLLYEANAAIDMVENNPGLDGKRPSHVLPSPDIVPASEVAAELYLRRALLRRSARVKPDAVDSDMVNACNLCKKDASLATADAVEAMLPQFEATGQLRAAAMIYCSIVMAIDAAQQMVPIPEDNGSRPCGKSASRRTGTDSSRTGPSEDDMAGPARAAEAVRRYGECLLITGDFKGALEAFGSANARAELLHRSDLAALALGGIAQIHALCGLKEKAQLVLLQSTAKIAECEDRGGMMAGLAAARELYARVHVGLCEKRDMKGSLENAYDALFEAFILYGHLQADAGKARIHMLRGRLLKGEGRIDEAEEEYQRAHELAESLRQKLGPHSTATSRAETTTLWTEVLLAFGDFLSWRREYKRAAYLFDLAESEARALDNYRLRHEALEGLAYAHKGMKQFEDAFECLESAHELAKNLARESYLCALAEHQVTSELDEADRNKTLLSAARIRAARARHDLMIMTLRMSEQTSLLDKIRTGHSAFLKAYDVGNEKGQKESLRKVQQYLQTAMQKNKNNWEMLDKQLAGLDPNFIESARKLHSTLTRTELRVAAWIRQDQSNDAIASAFACEIKTIYKHRQQMAEKMNLPSIYQLDSYLRSIDT